jgi:hypothetical protein
VKRLFPAAPLLLTAAAQFGRAMKRLQIACIGLIYRYDNASIMMPITVEHIRNATSEAN